MSAPTARVQLIPDARAVRLSQVSSLHFPIGMKKKETKNVFIIVLHTFGLYTSIPFVNICCQYATLDFQGFSKKALFSYFKIDVYASVTVRLNVPFPLPRHADCQ